MSRARQPMGGGGDDSNPQRWWILPLLVLALAVYVLWTGGGLARNNQQGHHWFFLAPCLAITSAKYIALSAALSTVFLFGGARFRQWMPAVLATLLVVGQLVFAHAAWGVLRGTMPWGFDHPSFMFRLREFGDLFPFALGGYNPWWNAGTEHFAGVTSGSHGFGLLILPLLKMWDPHVFYGAALIFWFVFGFPWLGVAAVRSAGVDRAGAIFAGLLLCGVSRGVFLWMWHFGTVGAMTSAMMALPVTALGYRLVVLRRGGWGTALALAISAWLMCVWTPGVFIGAGLVLGWLWNARLWSWRRNRWLIGAGVLAMALLTPWFWTTLFPCRNVMEYVGTAMDHPGWGVMALSGAKRLLCSVQETHPVLVVLGLGGVLLALPREMRRWMLPLFLVLGAITGWGREWKPLSQLDRMTVPLAVVSVFPAAALCGRLFSVDGEVASGGRRRAWLWAAAQGVVLGTILMGFCVVKMYYTNQGAATLQTLPPDMLEFVEWIRAEVPEEGRLGFAGPAIRYYGGGNIAYLPVLAGREMMADDYYAFPRGTIEYNYPPLVYRKDIDSYLFFSRAYGITHWVPTTPDARAFLASHPDRFEQANSMAVLGHRIEVYRMMDSCPVSRFWEGAGRVSARENRLEVFPSDPAAERVVIRYNWRDGLFCRTSGASIEPVAVDENLRFIAVHPGENARVEIGYRPHAAPVKPNFDGTFHH